MPRSAQGAGQLISHLQLGLPPPLQYLKGFGWCWTLNSPLAADKAINPFYTLLETLLNPAFRLSYPRFLYIATLLLPGSLGPYLPPCQGGRG